MKVHGRLAITLLLTAAAFGLAACDDGASTTPVSVTPSVNAPSATTTSPASTPTAAATVTPSPTPVGALPNFVAESTVVNKAPANAAAQAILEDVRVARNTGYDRIVFEYRPGTPLPGYEARYIPVASQCGSGQAVAAAGGAQFAITMRPAVAHENGASTVSGNTITTSNNPVIKQSLATCDFEGVVAWVVGVEKRRPFRVFELQDPPRIVIDFQSP